MVQCHIKVAHIPPGHDAYLNLDKDIIARAPIVGKKSIFKLTQDVLDRAYPDYQCDTFKIDFALVDQTLYNVFTDTDAYVCVNQKKSIQDG